MEKLRELSLTTLEERRHRADMALMNSIVSGRTDMEREEWFEMASDGPRHTRNAADPLNVKRQHGRLDNKKKLIYCKSD